MLDYAGALRSGQDIGSGPTEAECKTLTLRLKIQKVNLVDVEGTVLAGYCNTATKEITVDCTFSLEAKKTVLLHESTHAAIYGYATKSGSIDSFQEENICDIVSAAFVQCWNDVDKIMRKLQ